MNKYYYFYKIEYIHIYYIVMSEKFTEIASILPISDKDLPEIEDSSTNINITSQNVSVNGELVLLHSIIQNGIHGNIRSLKKTIIKKSTTFIINYEFICGDYKIKFDCEGHINDENRSFTIYDNLSYENGKYNLFNIIVDKDALYINFYKDVKGLVHGGIVFNFTPKAGLYFEIHVTLEIGDKSSELYYITF